VGHSASLSAARRDRIFGCEFVEQVKAMGRETGVIRAAISVANGLCGVAHRFIRREYLDHVIVLGEPSLHRTLTAYTSYYPYWRTHLALSKNTPRSRRTQLPAEGTLRSLGRSNRSRLEESYPFSRLAVFTIATNAERPERRVSAPHESAFWQDPQRRYKRTS
jgi:hypothetical protein